MGKCFVDFNACIDCAIVHFTAHPAILPGFNECMFDGKFYQVGESFHPVTDAEGYVHEACYNCTCQPVSENVVV